MKKLLFAIIAGVTMCACDSFTPKEVESVEAVDTVAVDSIVVDSLS